MIIISKSLSQTRQTKVRCIFRLKQRLRYYGQLGPPPLLPTPPHLREKVGHFGQKLWTLYTSTSTTLRHIHTGPDRTQHTTSRHIRSPRDIPQKPPPSHFSNIPRKLSVEHWVESITPSLGPLQRIRIRDMTRISQLDHFILDRQATEGSIRSFVWRCARSLKSGQGAISQQAHFIPMVVQSIKYEPWFTTSCWSFCLFDPTIN